MLDECDQIDSRAACLTPSERWRQMRSVSASPHRCSRRDSSSDPAASKPRVMIKWKALKMIWQIKENAEMPPRFLSSNGVAGYSQRRVNTAQHLLLLVISHKVSSCRSWYSHYSCAWHLKNFFRRRAPPTSSTHPCGYCFFSSATASLKIRTSSTETTSSIGQTDSVCGYFLCELPLSLSLCETAQPRLCEAQGYSGLSMTATPGGVRRIKE